MIASETDGKVTESSPSFKIHKGSAKSTQKGDTGHFGKVAAFTRREPCLDSFRLYLGMAICHAPPRPDLPRPEWGEYLGRLRGYGMGSGIIYYEIEQREKYELPVESLLALRHHDPSKKKGSSPQEFGPSRRASSTPQYSPLSPVIRLEFPSFSPKMGDDVEGNRASEEVPERVDDAKGI
ncbi:hypothetical protein PIB30_059530 [Stylosanthes scabra]|uniref:Uncharacterized protein n=1 Tax=Stylosanthes scabra TaxID=79078 RepID=A0ABU6SM36_9FABA|nr:hypothetical protein [Stylosanthes scabra]